MQWSCPGCGASSSGEASTAPAVCPRCGQPAGSPAEAAQNTASATCPTQMVPVTPLTHLLGQPGPPPGCPGDLPTRIGRYAVLGVVGSGSFGTVYLAHDRDLNRPVAIKVPVAQQLGSENSIASVLKEAQLAAGLRHPGIVTIHDVGRLPNGDCFFVMEYVPGQNLSQVLKDHRLSPVQAADLMLGLAAALRHAHDRGLIHRDLKPSNVLIDAAGLPRVADFGLAVEQRTQHLAANEVTGTPTYMAPEQVRGEAHRLDARTDIWALGVILYEMLTQRRPFGGSRQELFDAIQHHDPRPPRQLNPAVPRGLERICLKCLAKRMSDRYPSAAALADDLGHWRGGPEALAASAAEEAGPGDSARLPVRVQPKGLRAFDEGDVEFFLHLLPGPRDRHGLPDSLAFWKARLEEVSAGQTFRVGLIYGPSGCGKTSLVKAGLLPRLAGGVAAVYLEATPGDTEGRLLEGLRRACPGLADGLGLAAAVAALREGEGLPAGKKVVVVLDQFEQWLYAHRDAADSELARALRQCDGGRVQGLLMVRDDFWMAIGGFFRELEVPLHEGVNSAPVGLFGARHARKVLAEFGRAFGRLPDPPGELTADQDRFLDLAVAELDHEGQVIPVHLSLFAELLKSRDWRPETLRDTGGPRGLGAAFLEETFGSPAAPAAHRRHAEAARAVLKALLPDRGTHIKGALRSRDELLAASGYAAQPEAFDELLRILDQELRLVTPADPMGGVGGPSYQLTHDYLVPSLREWLARKRKETWRGRAELMLEERAAEWGESRDPRFLLSTREYLAACFGVPRRRRTPEQQALVSAAGRRHGLRWAGLLAAAAVVVVAVQQYLASARHAARMVRAEALVETVLRASADGVPFGVEALRPLRDLAVPLLRSRFDDAGLDPRQRLHAAAALAAFGQAEVGFLCDSVVTAPASEGQNLLAALTPVRDEAAERLLDRFSRGADRPARARLAAALLHLGDASAARVMLAYAPDPADRVAFLHEFAHWRGDLSRLPALLRDGDDPALRSGLCAALGLVPPDLLTAAQQERLQPVLRELYRRAADAGTHAAAGWALRRWGAEPPELAPGESPPAGRQWFVNREGLTMVAIAPGSFTQGDRHYENSLPRATTVTRPFFLCDREVGLDQFRRFLDDPDPKVEKPAGWSAPGDEVAPSGDCPVVMVCWDDAALFCNWLSRREGLRPCYRRTGRAKGVAGGKEVEYDVWVCDFDAGGYRLPTEAEWEYACRAGTTTPWSFGDDEAELRHFGVFRQPRLAPGGTKLPNPWGLFDMHGNAREWCWDTFHRDTYKNGPTTDPRGPDRPAASRVHRGGSWFDFSEACRSGYRNVSPCDLRDTVAGFRVARGATAHPKDAGGSSPP